LTDIVELGLPAPPLGHRKIAEMLRSPAGWVVNDKGGSGGARG
jgi:hypothetical protein